MAVLVVQMGHSGRTSGATGAPGEMAFTEAVGAACARLLGRDGWSVRTIGADLPAASYRGDAFVAVHADGSTNPAVRGASVGWQGDPGRALALAWQAAYVARGFTGPWHPANYTTNLAQYYGVRTARAQGNFRACIIEAGTITNAQDRALMLPDRVALAIGDAIGIRQPATEDPDMYGPDEDLRDDFMAWRLHRTLQLDPTLQSHIPVLDTGEALPLVDLLKGLRADVDELRSRPAAGPSAAEVAAEIIRQLGA